MHRTELNAVAVLCIFFLEFVLHIMHRASGNTTSSALVPRPIYLVWCLNQHRLDFAVMRDNRVPESKDLAEQGYLQMHMQTAHHHNDSFTATEGTV
ncbi:hypothetical protein EV426DRAFT_249738 [Tirmania nivea]|nr:hypothetical protein EV426DRAFT_249738 [Tirmania nivea]